MLAKKAVDLYQGPMLNLESISEAQQTSQLQRKLKFNLQFIAD